jgi:hypothetical protein
MEQKISAKSKKRMWSIIITIHVMGKVVVKMGKWKFNRKKEYIAEYCHPSATKIYKVGNRLHVVEGKKEHVYDGDRIESIQIREHKRRGVQ